MLSNISFISSLFFTGLATLVIIVLVVAFIFENLKK